jgi:hypothetical protein
MGEYQTDAGPMDALRTQLKAVRTESARRDPTELGVAVLAARERLVHRLEPLPERIAAINSRVTAKIEELGGTLRPSREPQSDAGSNCETYMYLAEAVYGIGHDSTDRGEMAFWYSWGDALLEQYDDCINH